MVEVKGRAWVLVLTFCLVWHRLSLLVPVAFAKLAGLTASGESPLSPSHLPVQVCWNYRDTKFCTIPGTQTWVIRLLWQATKTQPGIPSLDVGSGDLNLGPCARVAHPLSSRHRLLITAPHVLGLVHCWHSWYMRSNQCPQRQDLSHRGCWMGESSHGPLDEWTGG